MSVRVVGGRGVPAAWNRRALTDALAAVARERGCYGMWVGVDTDNDPALATYRASGAVNDGEFTMLTWEFTTENGSGDSC